MLAVGADGYAATVSYGGVSPDFGNRGLLVALTEDGKPLARPRLVVSCDVKGVRFVSDLVELQVVRLGKPASHYLAVFGGSSHAMLSAEL